MRSFLMFWGVFGHGITFPKFFYHYNTAFIGFSIIFYALGVYRLFFRFRVYFRQLQRLQGCCGHFLILQWYIGLILLIEWYFGLFQTQGNIYGRFPCFGGYFCNFMRFWGVGGVWLFFKVSRVFWSLFRLCLVTVFVFYFQKLVFGNIKKKQFSHIFEIKNMFGQLKLKRQFFEEKNKKY